MFSDTSLIFAFSKAMITVVSKLVWAAEKAYARASRVLDSLSTCKLVSHLKKGELVINI